MRGAAASPPESVSGSSWLVVSDLMALVLLALAIAGVAMDRPSLYVLGSVVLVLSLAARMWTRLALEGVEYSLAAVPERALEGDELTLTLCVENRKSLPVPWLRIQERLPPGLALVSGEAPANRLFGATVLETVTGLGASERVRIRYRVRADRRGHYVLGPARLEAGDPFGFYRSRRTVVRSVSHLLVYPTIADPPLVHLMCARPLGDVLARRRTLADPNRPATVREYRRGDPPRTIDWKVTAKRGAPWVRVDDASASGAVALLVECDTREGTARDVSPGTLEASVRTAASLAADLLARGHAVGVVANGVPPGDRARVAIAPGAGPDQLALVLESLARVQPIVMKTLAALVAENAARAMPFGASVVCVASVVHPDTAGMLDGFRARGTPTLLVHPPSARGAPVREAGVADGRWFAVAESPA